MSVSAVGTAHFVTAEFIPLKLRSIRAATSAIGTTDLVTWELIHVLFKNIKKHILCQ